MRISVTLRKKKISEEVIEKVIEIGELIDVNHQKASLFGIVVGTEGAAGNGRHVNSVDQSGTRLSRCEK